MCGRYTLFAERATLAERFDVTVPDDLSPRYNCAPGQPLPVVASDAPDRMTRKEWGLVPSWADDDTGAQINARGETVAEKPTFREAFRERRCLVPADGFYEWVETDEGKRPYRVAFADGRPFAMAGVWARWTPPTAQTGLGDFGADGPSDPEPRETFAVVTTEPNDLVAGLHHRMAVVLAPGEEATWLHGSPEEARALLDPYPADEWTAHEVSTRVNDVSNDGPALVEPVG
jgi:putative SOS response-associated peptidase YedK